MNKMGMGQSEVVRECLTCSKIHLALGKQGSHRGLGAAGTWSSAGGLPKSCSSWDAPCANCQLSACCQEAIHKKMLCQLVPSALLPLLTWDRLGSKQKEKEKPVERLLVPDPSPPAWEPA